MMQIKILGIIVVFVMTVAIGMIFADSYRREARRMRSFLRLIAFIRTQIGSFHAPLEEIYCKYEDKDSEIRAFLSVMKEKGFESATGETLTDLNLSGITCSTLREFAAGLGKSDAADQVKRCELCEAVLAEELRRSEEALPGKIRVCRALTVSIAVMTAILLI